MSAEKRELSRIRHLLIEKSSQILSELANRKSIGKRQCQQWIEQLVDLVITYDNREDDSLNFNSNIDSIETNDSKRKLDNSCDDILTNDDNKIIDNKAISPIKKNRMNTTVNTVSDESVVKRDHNLRTRSDDNQCLHSDEENQAKGVINGLQSIHTIHDYSPKLPNSDPEFVCQKNENKSKKKQSKKAKKKISEQKKVVLETTDGKVLGGGESTSASIPMSREMLAKVAEERLAKMESRGSKGVVKLQKPLDRTDLWSNSSNSGLKWKI